MKNLFFLLTCEHGGNKVPKTYQKHFSKSKRLLATHRGLDIGALGVAQLMAKSMKAPLVYSEVSRLLVDLNRSIGHHGQFSELSSQIQTRDDILEKFYFPHQVKVQNEINAGLKRTRRIVHLGIHSFTPKLNGVVRNADIGILFDPQSLLEAKFSKLLKEQIKIFAPDLKVRMNYPYKGTSDGLTRSLRKAFHANNYAGIEIEMNQKFFVKDVKANQKMMAQILSQSILKTGSLFS